RLPFDLARGPLLRARLVREVFGVELSLRALFEGPTVEALARKIATAGRDVPPPLVPVPRDGGPLPLSFAQERLWFLDQLEPGTPTLNMPAALRVREALDLPALARALAEAARRHESLRTTFGSAEGTPFQRIGPPVPVPLPLIDLGGLEASAARHEAGRLETDEYRLPFDLARGPLLRARLVRERPEDWTLLLTLHHIVSDGWSMGLLGRELGALYRAFAAGEPSPLPPLPVQYADYAAWQRGWLAGEVLERQTAYWREKLGGVPPLDLPTDRPRPAVQTFRGASVSHPLGPDLAGSLSALARREGATLFMVLLAGFQVLLSRLAGQEDFAVGAPVAGRGRTEIEGLVGVFLNNLALRANLSGDPTVRELLARVRSTALEAYTHQDVPFERLLEDLNPERDLSRTPVFQVFLNMLNLPGGGGGLAGDGEGSVLEVPSKFDLTIYAAETARGIALDFVYNADLFDRERVAEMAEQLEALFAQIAEDPEARTSSLSLLTPAARAVLPDPADELPFRWPGSIPDRVASQAHRTP
ncbi:MAG: condensation domain-containing protein, partial [Thermoanaerobaculia bacterium]